MSISLPEFAPSDGAVLTVFVTTLADPTAPTLAELTGPSAVAGDCYWEKENQPAFTPDTETVERNPACLRDSLESAGRTKWTGDNFRAGFDPQNPESVANRLYVTLPEHSVVYIAQRYGIYVEDSPAIEAGQIVDVFRLRTGAKSKLRQEKNKPAEFTVGMFEIQRVAVDYEVPAA